MVFSVFHMKLDIIVVLVLGVGCVGVVVIWLSGFAVGVTLKVLTVCDLFKLCMVTREVFCDLFIGVSLGDVFVSEVVWVGKLEC